MKKYLVVFLLVTGLLIIAVSAAPAESFTVTYTVKEEQGGQSFCIEGDDGSHIGKDQWRQNQETSTGAFVIWPLLRPGATDLRDANGFLRVENPSGPVTVGHNDINGTAMFRYNYYYSVFTDGDEGDYYITRLEVDGWAGYGAGRSITTPMIENSVGTITVTYSDKPTLDNAEITLSEDNFIWSGNPCRPAVTSVKVGSSTISTAQYTVTYGNNVNPGTGTVTVKGRNGFTGSKTVTFPISKAPSVVDTMPAAAGGLVYDGSMQTLVTAGSVTGGTMLYSTDGTSFSTALPKACNAGYHQVYYKVQPDANHTATGVKMLVAFIGKGQARMTAAPRARTGLVWTGENQTLITAGTGNLGTPEYSLEEEGTYTTALPAAAEPGDYTVFYLIPENDNYDGTETASLSVTIARAPLTVTPPAAVSGLAWTGEEQTLVEAGFAAGGTMQYSTSGTDYSTELPRAAEVGTYTVYYRAAGDDHHTDATPQALTVSIAKAAPEVTPPVGLELLMSGDEENLILPGVASHGEFLYSLNEDGPFSEEIPRTAVPGTYTVYYYIPGDDHYEELPVSSVTAAISGNDLTYTDADGETGTLAVYVSLSSFSTDSPDTLTGGGASDGWYAVTGKINFGNNRLEVEGDVKLLLANTAELTVSGGIHVPGNASLTVYGQHGDAGRLVISGPGEGNAGIGGNSGETSGAVTINGGSVTVTGGTRGAGIGSGRDGTSGAITIHGGMIRATGGTNGCGIGGKCSAITISGGTVQARGCGSYQNQPTGAGIGGTVSGEGNGMITITGGTVDATGNGGPGIGGRRLDVQITGGRVTAANSDDDPGIGPSGSGGTVTIRGDAVVEAFGGDRSAGIGGSTGNDGFCTVIGGNAKVLATGGQSGAGIGSYSNYTITIGENAEVAAAGGMYGAGIGGGYGSSGGQIRISGNAEVRATAGEEGGSGIGSGYGSDDQPGATVTLDRGSADGSICVSADSYRAQVVMAHPFRDGRTGASFGGTILPDQAGILDNTILSPVTASRITCAYGQTVVTTGNTVTNWAEPGTHVLVTCAFDSGYGMGGLTVTGVSGTTVPADIVNNEERYELEEETGYVYRNYETIGFDMPDEGVTVSFETAPILYPITFDTAGGVLPEGTACPAYYTVEDTEILLPNPKRLGLQISAVIAFDQYGDEAGYAYGTADSLYLTYDCSDKRGPLHFQTEWIEIIYDITISKTGEGGASTQDGASMNNRVDVLTAPEPGYYVKSITFSPAGGEETDITDGEAFVMPASDVTVRVQFARAPVFRPDTVLPADLTEIDSEAFANTSVKQVNVPVNCTRIGAGAFRNCQRLTAVMIYPDCSQIASDAFAGCPVVYIHAEFSSAAYEYCKTHPNCIFVQMQ